MKRLTKTLLINWLYYDKLLLDFFDINYLVGKNASGKSTFLDAIMIVLLGEVSSRNFNKAANESSQRSLQRYLRADMDPNNPRTRKARTFNTYIACEFWDDVSGKSFTAGIVFDCHADGSERHSFFTYDERIPEDCFIVNRKPMDIGELRRYLRDTYKSRQEVFDSNKKYRSAIKAKWNIHVDQVFSVLKRGAFFKPIDDIREFITENVCDVQEKPDIVSMQQNIQDYKHQEKIAQRQEDKLVHLQKIHELYRRHARAQELLDIHEFLKAKAEADMEQALVSKYETELKNCKLELESLEIESKRLSSEADELQTRHDRLIASEPFKEYERLEAEKARLTGERESLLRAMEKTAVAIRTEVFQWLRYCEKIEASPWVGEDTIIKLKDNIPELKKALIPLERLAPDDFGHTDPSLFKHAHEALNSHNDLLRGSCYELERAAAQLKAELEECALSLRELEKGNKDYPETFLKFRSALAKKILEDMGNSIPLYPLADLLEITDPVWRNAVEGYLNTQRFLLIVEPQFYLDALRAYNKIKREFSGYGLVDVEKVRRRDNIQRLPNSLATKVTPTSELVKEYINFLLGRVICCKTVEELRRYGTAITSDGMLYQGYVSRAISRQLLDSVYIGKRALEQQIQSKKSRIQELSAQSKILSSAYSVLEKQKKKEPLLTGYYIADTVNQMPNHHARCLEIVDGLSELHDRLDQLNRGGLLGIAEQIATTKSLIEKNHIEYIRCAKDERSREDRIKLLMYEILPDHCQKMGKINDWISERFPESFIVSTGETRYQEELNRLKSPKSIQKNFGDQLEQTKSRRVACWQDLVYKRRDYANIFPPCSFQPDNMLNDDFDRELDSLQQIELPKYKEKIKAARESALEQFKNDFLAKLRSNIGSVEDQVRDLNKALKRAQFTDQYRFIVDKNPDYADYYNMIMDPDHMENKEGLFSLAFQRRYGILIEELFKQIVASDHVELNAKKQSELQQNIEKYTDYRTYLHFDLETTDQNGNVEYLSKTLKTKSGGETQTPFYIAILASFAQVYKTYDKSSFGNTMRLVVFDEAFNKMDSERIIECIRLLRKMGLQAIFSTPPEKLPDIMPEADITYLTYKEGYRMHMMPWSKKLEDKALELQ